MLGIRMIEVLGLTDIRSEFSVVSLDADANYYG